MWQAVSQHVCMTEFGRESRPSSVKFSRARRPQHSSLFRKQKKKHVNTRGGMCLHTNTNRNSCVHADTHTRRHNKMQTHLHTLSLIPYLNPNTCTSRLAIIHAGSPSRVLHCSTFPRWSCRGEGGAHRVDNIKQTQTHKVCSMLGNIRTHRSMQPYTHTNRRLCVSVIK